MIRTLICATASLCAWVTSLPDFDHVKAQRFAMTQAQELLLQQDCEAMNSEGNIQDLITDLNRNAEALANLRMKRHSMRNQYRIHQIQADIHRITTRAKNILRPEWTDSRWPYKAAWTIRFTDAMEIDSRVIASSFAFSDFELEGLNLGGLEREDLYPLVNVTTQSQSILVEIEKKASSLELCQLQSTWAIEGTVKFMFKNENYDRKSELSLRPGAVRLSEPKPEPAKLLIPNPVFRPREPFDSAVEDHVCKILRTCPPFHAIPIPRFPRVPTPRPEEPVQ